MPRRRVLLLGSLALAAAARAQPAPPFPARPVTLVVPFAPGGVADLTARAVAEGMAQRLGQPVIVDNRPSAGSIVASVAVAKAAPDGHTLLLMSNANAVSVSLFRKLPYDPQRDFAPVAPLAAFDLGIFAAASSRHATLAGALAEARARPGRITVGTIAVGSTQHLAAELLKTAAGVDLLIVPYKATPAVVTALRAGEIDLAVEIVAPLLAQVRGGALRALAVTGAQRNPALPEVPTAEQSPVDDFEVASWNAIAAPAGTPPAVIATLNRAVREAAEMPAVRERLAPLGLRLATGSPGDLQALLAREIRRWGEVVRAAKIVPE
jgi:tripartite-type tricarboxylate transporter receptor subunit TctC